MTNITEGHIQLKAEMLVKQTEPELRFSYPLSLIMLSC